CSYGSRAGQGPSTSTASSVPGQGGLVEMTRDSGSAPVERNWKLVPSGIVSASPGDRSVTSSGAPAPPQSCPAPPRMYQTSSTGRGRTACVAAPLGKLQ